MVDTILNITQKYLYTRLQDLQAASVHISPSASYSVSLIHNQPTGGFSKRISTESDIAVLYT